MVFCDPIVIHQQNQKCLEDFPELRSDRKPKLLIPLFHSQGIVVPTVNSL